MKSYVAIALILCCSVATSASFEHAAGLAGLLQLPEVFGSEPCDRFKSSPIDLFASPEASIPVGQIYVASPWSYPAAGGCEGLSVRVKRAASAADEELPTLEYAYEQPAAIVVSRKGSRFELALATGTAWMNVTDPSRFLPVEKLLSDGLLYLRSGSLKHLYHPPSDSGTLLPVVGRSDVELPVKLLSYAWISERLWLNVQLQHLDECSQESTGLQPLAGWLPFHGKDGRPTLWFRSRGC